MTTQQPTRTFRLTEIHPDEVRHTDLREELDDNAEHGTFRGRDDRAWRIDIDGEAQAAEAAFVAHESSAFGRLGIAWGADATWGDADTLTDHSIEDAINEWLNDAEAWESRA